MSVAVLETNPFRRILIASDIELAVRDLLKKWFPTYMREIERQIGWDREPLSAPVHYTNRTSFDIQPGEALPKAVVISPGVVSAPTHPEGGQAAYWATWQMAVGIATSSNSEELADYKCKMYGAAVRAIMVQHQTLERDDVMGVRWVDESYDDLDIPDQLMSYRGAAILFAIDVEDVVTRWAGPANPDESAQEDHIAETVDVRINKIPVDEEVPEPS